MVKPYDEKLARGELYLAGQRVPAGVYKQIESNRIVILDMEDFLPASLDGRVACYECINASQERTSPSRHQRESSDTLKRGGNDV